MACPWERTTVLFLQNCLRCCCPLHCLRRCPPRSSPSQHHLFWQSDLYLRNRSAQSRCQPLLGLTVGSGFTKRSIGYTRDGLSTRMHSYLNFVHVERRRTMNAYSSAALRQHRPRLLLSLYFQSHTWPSFLFVASDTIVVAATVAAAVYGKPKCQRLQRNVRWQLHHTDTGFPAIRNEGQKKHVTNFCRTDKNESLH